CSSTAALRNRKVRLEAADFVCKITRGLDLDHAQPGARRAGIKEGLPIRLDVSPAFDRRRARWQQSPILGVHVCDCGRVLRIGCLLEPCNLLLDRGPEIKISPSLCHAFLRLIKISNMLPI